MYEKLIITSVERKKKSEHLTVLLLLLVGERWNSVRECASVNEISENSRETRINEQTNERINLLLYRKVKKQTEQFLFPLINFQFCRAFNSTTKIQNREKEKCSHREIRRRFCIRFIRPKKLLRTRFAWMLFNLSIYLSV